MHRWRTAALGLLLIAVAGCGSKTTAAPPDKATAKPAPTAVPIALVNYASQARPVLKQSLDTVNALVSELGSSHDYPQIAYDCASKAAGLASSNNVFQGFVPPPQASSYVSDAVSGYGKALTAADECSTAADARVPGDVNTARSDFQSAASDLSRAETGVNAWYGAH